MLCESCSDRPRIKPLQNNGKWNIFTHLLPFFMFHGILLHRPCEMVKPNTTRFVCKTWFNRNLTRNKLTTKRAFEMKQKTNNNNKRRRRRGWNEKQHPIIKCYEIISKRFSVRHFQEWWHIFSANSFAVRSFGWQIDAVDECENVPAQQASHIFRCYTRNIDRVCNLIVA